MIYREVLNREKLGIPWSDIPFLWIRYFIRILLDGMERKVIPIIDNDATAKEEDGREETTAIEDAMPIEIATR